jgi:catechol 2,3-dioxygenase-like lactoylglutathione lyase family enzyme
LQPLKPAITPAKPDEIQEENNMSVARLGNASAITVPRQDRDSIRRFYCDVLGGKIVKEDDEKHIFRLEEEFYILFRYDDVPDESEFLRSPRALWLQIKSDNAEELTRKILDFGATKIDLPSGLPESVPYLYFQAPGGQCFQLLPINEDQAYYKGAGDGPNIAKEKDAEGLKEEAISELALRHHQKSTRL